MFHTCKKRDGKKFQGAHLRGQFTIFVILGLIIFMIFAFAIYARAKIQTSMLGQQADIQLKNYLSDNAINQYVDHCLDEVVDDTIITASMQGGLLNSTGLSPNVDFIEYYSPEFNRTFNVSIVIDANINCSDGRDASNFIVSEIPGPYPLNPLCANDYVANLPDKYLSNTGNCKNTCTRNDFRKYSGFFGVNNMSMLCDPNGANSPTLPGIYGPNTCEYYSYYRKSMQQLLEDKITNDINVCVNFTEILSKTPSNITAVGSVNTTIQFAKGGFNVKLEYPFTILMWNKQPVTRLVNFGVSKDIPFKELYEYTYELANYDVKNASFEIQRDKDKVYSKGSSNRDMLMYNWYYKINIIDGNVSNNFTRLVQVIDTLHNINGVPLTISFAIKNRAPVLDYINNGQSKLYDLVAVENRTILISPQGYDPDDDPLLTYTYGGWLEEYTDYYNFSDHNCSAPSSLEYILENCTKQNLTDNNPPHNWTKSAPYKATGKNASYDASSSDIGLHNVIVSVFDSHGLYDFQTVRILVFDLPIARISGSNDYDDVDKHRASYEDRYFLNGAESTVGVIESATGAIFNTFIWTDPSEPFSISRPVDNNNISTKQLLLPNDAETPPPTYDITNITKYIFVNTTDAYKIHNITLTVITSNSLSNINTFYVNVTRCLNHSSDVPSYPFDMLSPNNVAADNITGHLMANHTCCTNDMTYAGTDTECYRATMYGTDKSFIDYSQLPDTQDYTPTHIYNGIPPLDAENDIFQQTFVTYCSNDRGNTCTGRIEETRTDITQCGDNNGFPENPALYVERCSGPQFPQYFAVNGSTTTNLNCQNYTRTTFEYLLGNPTATGHCTGTQPQPATGNGITWATDGKYSCNGACSSGTCVPSDCTCQKTASNNNAPSCDGIPYPGVGQPNTPSCNAGPTYFADTCNACELASTNNNICRDSSYGNGCTADPSCNDIQINDYAKDHNNNNQNFCLPADRTRWTICNSSCQASKIETINLCRTGPGCISSSECENVFRNSQISAEVYCTLNCQYKNCSSTNSAYRYDSNTQDCFNSCTLANENTNCNPGHTCIGNQCQ